MSHDDCASTHFAMSAITGLLVMNTKLKATLLIAQTRADFSLRSWLRSKTAGSALETL